MCLSHHFGAVQVPLEAPFEAPFSGVFEAPFAASFRHHWKPRSQRRLGIIRSAVQALFAMPFKRHHSGAISGDPKAILAPLLDRFVVRRWCAGAPLQGSLQM